MFWLLSWSSLQIASRVCLQSRVSDINQQNILGTSGSWRTNSGQTMTIRWSMPQKLCGPTLVVDRKSTCEPKHYKTLIAWRCKKHIQAFRCERRAWEARHLPSWLGEGFCYYIKIKSFFDSRCATPICQVSETDAEASRRAWSSESKWGELCKVSKGLVLIWQFTSRVGRTGNSVEWQPWIIYCLFVCLSIQYVDIFWQHLWQ